MTCHQPPPSTVYEFRPCRLPAFHDGWHESDNRTPMIWDDDTWRWALGAALVRPNFPPDFLTTFWRWQQRHV